MQSNPDNKNLLLAIVLSVMVMIGWNYFFGVPQVDKARQQTQSRLNPQDMIPGADKSAAPAAAPQQPGALTPATPGVREARSASAAQSRGADAPGPPGAGFLSFFFDLLLEVFFVFLPVRKGMLTFFTR